MTHEPVPGYIIERLKAGAFVTSSPTLAIGTDVVEQIVDEIVALRAVAEAARRLLAEDDVYRYETARADLAAAIEALGPPEGS